MEEIYCIAALSGYNHQEGYLDIMLRKLYLENKATFGYDPYDERLVRILFDEMDLYQELMYFVGLFSRLV